MIIDIGEYVLCTGRPFDFIGKKRYNFVNITDL